MAAASLCLDVLAVISGKVAYLIYLYNIHRTCARACKWSPAVGSVLIVLKLRKNRRAGAVVVAPVLLVLSGNYGGYASAFARCGCAVLWVLLPLLFIV